MNQALLIVVFQSVFSIAFDNAVEPDHHDERIPLMTWQTCAFTVQAVVWSVLDQGRSIFGQVRLEGGEVNPT